MVCDQSAVEPEHLSGARGDPKKYSRTRCPTRADKNKAKESFCRNSADVFLVCPADCAQSQEQTDGGSQDIACSLSSAKDLQTQGKPLHVFSQPS